MRLALISAHAPSTCGLHLATGAGRAMVCARGSTFAEATAAFSDAVPETSVDAGDPHACAQALTRMLGDDILRAKTADLSAQLGGNTAGSRVAEQHLAVYRDALGHERLHTASR